MASIGKLKRKLGRLQASNRIKAHAQWEAQDAIFRGRVAWIREGEKRAREALTRVIEPPVDDRFRATLMNKKPDQPVLAAPVFGPGSRSFSDHAQIPSRAEVVRFEYRPMELRVHDQRFVWWDLVPMEPWRSPEYLADDVAAICDELRHPLWLKHIGYHAERLRYISEKLESLVARMRLSAREIARAQNG